MTPDEFKQRRKALGYTQKDLAEMWGHDIRTIRRWESGQTEIPTLAVWGICLLGITESAALRHTD
jgi:DNA-binding transcriptional regulator YiaG